MKIFFIRAFVDENQVMRFKLVSLPKNTAKLPVLEVPSPSLVFNGPGVTQTITPNTRNGSDAEDGYSFTLHDFSNNRKSNTSCNT